MNNKKGQSAGLITGLVFGIASLVIGVIIAFVIVSSLTGADLLTSGRSYETIVNETGSANGTGHTLTHYSDVNVIATSFSITSVYNASVSISSGNYTLASGILTNSTAASYDALNVSYTYTVSSNEEVSTDSLSGNFTAGVDNISEKIPTVLLVAAIVLILGVLVLLVGAWQRMRIGGGSI